MSVPKTHLKTILVFQDGELIKQLRYKTKTLTIGNFRLFKKFGIYDLDLGGIIPNATFELL